MMLNSLSSLARLGKQRTFGTYSSFKLAHETFNDRICEHFNTGDPGTIFNFSFDQGNITRQLLLNNHKVFALSRNISTSDSLNSVKKEFGDTNFVGLQGKISNVPHLIEEHGLQSWAKSCTGIIAKFGPSPSQLMRGRGLNYHENEPLDLRFAESGASAAEVLEHLDLTSLTRVLSRYGAVRNAKEICTTVVEQRYLNKKIRTTHQLRDLVIKSTKDLDFFDGPDGEYLIEKNIDQTFLALRLFVNNELNEMNFAIKLAHTLLPSGASFIVFLQSPKEEKHFKHGLFSKLYKNDIAMKWIVEKKDDIDENNCMYFITKDA